MDPRYAQRYEEWDRDHWWFAARRKVLGSLLCRSVRDREGTVLDIGCGTGGSLDLLSRHGRVTGVDFDDRMARIAAREGYASAIASRAEALPFKPESFDVIAMLDVLEHLDDEATTLKEMFRVCAPAGFIVITVPAYRFLWSSHDVVNHHRRRYRREEIGTLVQAAGFQVLRLTYFNAVLFFPIAIIRMGRRMLGLDGKTGSQSDFERARWAAVDKVSETLFSAERFVLPSVNLPFGVSIACIARRPS